MTDDGGAKNMGCGERRRGAEIGVSAPGIVPKSRGGGRGAYAGKGAVITPAGAADAICGLRCGALSAGAPNGLRAGVSGTVEAATTLTPESCSGSAMLATVCGSGTANGTVAGARGDGC